MLPQLKESLPSDFLAWTHGLVVAPYQTRIGIRVNGAELLAEVRQRLLPGWREEQKPQVDYLWSIFSGQDQNLLYYGTELLSDRPQLMVEFDRYFHLYVGHTARERTFVHAGVVGYGDRALILPGSSYSGKSTLTRALVDQGATFYSDDLAVIDARGRVHPYPKPMSMRTAGSSEETSALQLGWHPDLPPLPVRLIASLRFQGEGGEWTEVRGAQASFALIENCLSIRREPARDMSCLTRLCAQSVSYHGLRGEANRAATRLLELLSAQPRLL
jgi:hypothetical protein